jgi:X-X-X-Leu-X-X-Gly heptad repeat protein
MELAGSIHEPFAVDGDPPVRGVLHRAADGAERAADGAERAADGAERAADGAERAADGADAIVLTHGAGSNADAPLLRALARAFAADGMTVLRCDLPFRQARASGPPSPAGSERDRRGLAAALAAMVARGARRCFIGGHSYGGRQASMLIADAPALARGVLLLSYPLHPPGNPARLRTEHLPRLRVPTLFVHGARDPFGTEEEIEAARALVPAATALHLLPRAAHALHADATTARAIVAAFRDLIERV